MRIAVDVTPILPGGECGGAKQFVRELLRGFGQRAPSDNFILLTSALTHKEFLEYEDMGMRRICVTPAAGRTGRIGRLLSAARTLFRLPAAHRILRDNRVDVLFCPMTSPALAEPGIPVVVVIYDLQHVYYPYFFSPQEVQHRNAFYRDVQAKAGAVVCISSYTRETVIEKLGLPAERVFAVPITAHTRLDNCPDTAVSDTHMRRLNLADVCYAFFPANLWPHKNHRVLLTAFSIFVRKYPDATLHLVMTGAALGDDASIDDAVSQMGLQERVHFLGYVEEDVLSTLWHRAYCLIFPSLFEGFGIPLLEAMRFRKPILASNATSIPEVAGDAALYFDPRRPDEIVRAIAALMENSSLYDELIARGQQRLQEFSSTETVDRYLAILHTAGAASK